MLDDRVLYSLVCSHISLQLYGYDPQYQYGMHVQTTPDKCTVLLARIGVLDELYVVPAVQTKNAEDTQHSRALIELLIGLHWQQHALRPCGYMSVPPWAIIKNFAWPLIVIKCLMHIFLYDQMQ